MKTSIFEIFKIGIGPSSSHTVGPMRAAAAFASSLRDADLLQRTARVEANLYGSLALTGHGHGTDRAILLGLSGELPDQIVPETIEPKLATIRCARSLRLAGANSIVFDEPRDLLFHKDQTLPFHSNGMRFCAFDSSGAQLLAEAYFSVGGGFVVREGEPNAANAKASVKYPFTSARELLALGEQHRLAVWQIGLENEKAWHSAAEVRAYVQRIWKTMQECMERGLATQGILPGGLNVRRRAQRLAKKLGESGGSDPLAPMDWVNVWAMAVNEENAAGGRVVTAPTNGAAGIIPAVAKYYTRYISGADDAGLLRYFLTASVIGVLYKENASISGAEVGCQGEVGVACSMAAGGLVAAQNGANGQIEYAAEIGMEHNLGMTCDPIGGLVQIPCIERNAIGAVKAINASRIALREGSDHKVSLDQVIKTMYETGLDMQSRYKETSLGGLALNVIEC
ncbi:MAG TPA: L-serine ammonia-lyase [Candidatus Eisenbacteria bacterium]|nr:L-serine ammonia-lyase [Candidatus Eisenbacteria bacterium]